MQIIMMFRHEVVDGKKRRESAADLPPPDSEFFAELFSASAITRYGQWSFESPYGHDLATKENAQKRWTEAAHQRRTEVSHISCGTWQR